MKITPTNSPGECRTGQLSNIRVDEINKVLGFTPNYEDDPDKVVNSWAFSVDGEPCGIWDYRGSHEFNQFSTYGPDEVFNDLFGDRYSA